MKKTLYFLLCLFLATACHPAGSLSTEKPNIERIPGLEIPAGFEGKVLQYKAFALAYNETHEQADWVAYELTGEEVDSGSVERMNSFYEDHSVLSGSAKSDDYKGSDYDRGHLCPAGDVHWDKIAMKQTFLMSNISPQNRRFNRGIWRKLENRCRKWAVESGGIYIVTGPVLHKLDVAWKIEKIGKNKVSVPRYYYKVVLDLRGKEKKAIGFLMANKESHSPLADYAVPVDEVERRTGLDFFPKLEKNLQEKLESQVQLNLWFEEHDN